MSNQSFEERFDEEFKHRNFGVINLDGSDPTRPILKSFIRKEKELSYAEGRREWLETVREEIEKMRQEWKPYEANETEVHNQALTDLLQALGLEK